MTAHTIAQDVHQIGLRPVEAVSILTVCDNTIDIFLIDEGPAHRILGRGGVPNMVAVPTMRERELIDTPSAQHGFSALVTVTFDGGTQRNVLFDFGISPDGCAANLSRLGHGPAEVDAVACSHGHFDHTAGLAELAAELGQRHIPFVVHPDFWQERRLVIGETVIDLPAVDRATIESAGFDIVEDSSPTLLVDSHVMITGQIPRITDFEQGFPFQQARHGDDWSPDPDTLDDQALIVNVADHGLIVLTGCGHSGLINTIHHAQHLTGVEQVHTIMGGFHLTGPMFEPRIEPTLDALDELEPSVIVATHCTGWKAIHAMAQRFPDAFVQNSVGTSIEVGTKT
jgi:7,8-dihydropterin-6-yl-methyl-4-(beta-D-ribofuranosyl)aminobenzene 5'-phosphate synthase